MRLLVLLSRFPHPLDKGDKLRAFYQLATLSRRHEIVLCALSDEPVTAASMAAVAPHCRRVEVVPLPRAAAWGRVARALPGRHPLQVEYFRTPAAARAVRELLRACRPDHVLAQLVRTAELARHLDGVPRTLDLMDAFSAGLEQRLRLAGAGPHPLVALEWRRLQRYEAEVLADFDSCTIITPQDRDRISSPERDRIRVVPNGVDLERFRPRSLPPTHDLLFVGNMRYPPNVLAARLLAEEILPRLERQRPSCRLLLAGTTPARAVLRLRSAAVDVSGWVDDIPACYASARVFVAPMRIGTGMQNKLLQAMAMGKPCVTSATAAAALGATGGEVVVADTADEYAEAVGRLLADPRHADEVGERGLAFVRANYRWEDAVETLEAALLGGRAAAARAPGGQP